MLGGVSAPFGKSKYAENLVLKGGLFIYSLTTDFDSRVTVDVDFLLR
ncbi:nucleotidyl transferase AbiEii/AbiGii toxin family protein [Bacteroides heparinolyticus]